MRVVVTNWKDTTHPAAGGAEVFCDQVARQLVAMGCEVTLLAGKGKRGDDRHAVHAGYRVRRLGHTYTVYAWALLWLFKHRRQIDAIIDSQNGIPFFTPLVARRQTAITLLIHHVHQEQFRMYFPPVVSSIGRWLERTVSRRVYGHRPICTVSPSSRSEVRRLLGLRGQIYVVPNGSAVSRATPVKRAPQPTITCVGRMVPHKRWDLLVDAVAELVDEVPHLSVNLLGAGPDLERLQHYVKDKGLSTRIHLPGFVSEAERDHLLGTAWLTVSASVGEGWGLSVIEAAAFGVPAVAIDVPGLRDSVRDGTTGWLTARDDLTKTIGTALGELGSPEIASRFRADCITWAGSLRWTSTAERFYAVLAAEAERVARRDDQRRARLDITTVINLNQTAAARLDVGLLRATDQSTFCIQCVDKSDGPWRVLLHGADERDALQMLARAGIEPEDGSVRIDLCRPSGLLAWQGDAVQHSFGGLGVQERCPAVEQSALAPSPSVRG